MSGSLNVCGWFIYRTIRWILLFLIWQSELRGQQRYYTNQIVLNSLWNSYLNQATKNVYSYLYFPKFPISTEIPWWKVSKQKRNPFIISVTSTLPSPSKPRLGPGLGSYIIVCVFLFGCWKLFDTFPPSSVCPGFCQFGNILMRCAIVLQYAV